VIVNIVKGRGVTGALAYAMGQGEDEDGKRIELVPGEKSRAEILGGQNFGFEIEDAADLELARRMMEWNGKEENQASRGRKCELDCLHMSLSWEPGQNPTRDEMVEAAKGSLKALGMETAQAVFIAHDDTAHKHLHIVASRIDPATGKTFSQTNDHIIAETWSLRYEREQGQIPQNQARQKQHRIMDAVEARDGAAVAEIFTERVPTFTARELDKALVYSGLNKEERTAFRSQILGDDKVIGLRETAQSPVTRYTTREALAAEMDLLRDTRTLAGNKSHGVDGVLVDAAIAAFTLKPEQDKALRGLTGEAGLAILLGQAGTGKSHVLKAANAVNEAAGKDVRGLAWTNDVMQQMRRDGFRQANTITSELNALEQGRTVWTRNTVVIVDEAAMVSTKELARLAAAARDAGAKLILAGDDKQLSSIERGGMFETLRQTHGAATLKEVQRVRDAEQKEAFGKMHEGEFLQALKTFDQKGGIHWTDRQSDTLKDMAARYTADVAATPDKRRFMFAYTNKDVATLNQHARALHRQRGELGQDHSLATKHGAAQFATGDRIQFTGNGRTKAEKNAGLTNGRVGTVTALAIDEHGKARVSVELDAAKGDKPQTVSFVVGENSKAGEFNSFKHGFAGTIYRGQGRTLDEAYVAHSAHWRSAAAYVALTRHREAVHIFAARETVKGLDDMAKGMARTDNKRAATAYSIDPHSAARAELDRAEAGISERPEAGSVKEAKEATTERGERLRQRDDRQARDEITRNQGRQRGERDRGGGMSR
jgi:ATP-dependent exoDNAse (exonuclease V) alpha subunit